MNPLDAPLSLRLPASIARKLTKAGIDTVEDLLFTPPRRYYHWGALTPMSLLRAGEEATILACVESTKLVTNRSRPGVRLEVRLSDGHSRMSATFFAKNEHILAPHMRLLTPGESFLFAGKVASYRGALTLTHPSFEGMSGDEDEVRERSERPIPIYPQTKGLTSWVMSRAIGMLLDSLSEEEIPELVPARIRQKMKLPPRLEALTMLHRPVSDEEAALARRALAWEEAFALECVLAGRRIGAQSLLAPACAPSRVVEDFLGGLPFTLTQAQESALNEILADLDQTRPMQRLLQGDVGSGKTVVALAALLAALGAGHQGVLVAPTEVLAAQHLESMRALAAGILVEGREVDIRLLTASTPAASRRELSRLMAAGEPIIVVGTHALLSDPGLFADLGLVVIDEQHRFGVEQRDRLRTGEDGRAAHQLVMTATPIPRTIAMTVFGDLAQTRMEGMPKGRTLVQTFLVDAENPVWMQRLWHRAAEEIARQGRVYVVCPRIDESEELADADAGESDGAGATRPPLASVSGVAQSLRREAALKGIGIGELSGRNSSKEKAETMQDFAAGRIGILVATTVIEVGVDVPEATMMVILDSQQFGISQLHQLRGRVGRSSTPSICMAVHRHELAEGTMERLKAFAETNNGFELAEKDLELRREGDVLGAEQSGSGTHLRFLSVRRDARIISAARKEALALVEADPSLAQHPLLAAELSKRGGDDLEWISRS